MLQAQFRFLYYMAKGKIKLAGEEEMEFKRMPEWLQSIINGELLREFGLKTGGKKFRGSMLSWLA